MFSNSTPVERDTGHVKADTEGLISLMIAISIAPRPTRLVHEGQQPPYRSLALAAIPFGWVAIELTQVGGNGDWVAVVLRHESDIIQFSATSFQHFTRTLTMLSW